MRRPCGATTVRLDDHVTVVWAWTGRNIILDETLTVIGILLDIALMLGVHLISFILPWWNTLTNLYVTYGKLCIIIIM